MSTDENSCVFCDIIAGKSPDTKILFENDNLIVIKDIKPASEHHYLAVPKRHIEDARKLKVTDRPLITEMETELKNLFTKEGFDETQTSYGFHWPPFISIKHLHMHGIAPTSRMGFLSRWIFKPMNIWYCTPQYVSLQLKEDCQLVNK